MVCAVNTRSHAKRNEEEREGKKEMQVFSSWVQIDSDPWPEFVERKLHALVAILKEMWHFHQLLVPAQAKVERCARL